MRNCASKGGAEGEAMDWRSLINKWFARAEDRVIADAPTEASKQASGPLFDLNHARLAEELEDESRRIIRKINLVREAMGEDVAVVRRLRAEADAALASAEAGARQLLDAERLIGEIRLGMEAAIEESQRAAARIDELNGLLSERDGKIAADAIALREAEENHREASEAAALANSELARRGLALNEALKRAAALERSLHEREEELAVQVRQIEQLERENKARQQQTEALEKSLQTMSGQFEEARRESQSLFTNIREAQLKAQADITKLEAEGEAMRRRLSEAERTRDRLSGQVDELRAENAGLRAEMQVKTRDLEEMNLELAASNATMERLLSTARAKASVGAEFRLVSQVRPKAVGG